MAQDITLLGASYSDVPSVTLPKTGGGTASFTDVTDTTATASDVAQGTYFYTAAGVRTAGTASSGGTIAVDSESQVGMAETGTALTGEPNYTPSGDIRLATQQATIIDTVSLSTSYSNYVLTIYGILTTSHAISVPTGATFDGSPVRLVIESEES